MAMLKLWRFRFPFSRGRMGRSKVFSSSRPNAGRGALSAVLDRLRELVSLDRRSMALFRVGMGVTCMFDIYSRITDGVASHYSDGGLFPRYLSLQYFQGGLWFDVYGSTGTETGVLFLFLLHVFFGFCLAIGWHTRLANFLVWIMTVSLQHRNVFIGHGGDMLQRVILFFAMFLPLGECFSIDAALRGVGSDRPPRSFWKQVAKHSVPASQRMLPLHSTPTTTRIGEGSGLRPSTTWLAWWQRAAFGVPSSFQYTSISSLAMILQILLMYYTAHHLKSAPEWRSEYTATFLAINLDFFRRGWVDFLLGYPEVLKLLTWAVLHWQLIGSLLYFSPVFTGAGKSLGALGFFAMHLSFAICFRLGQFNFITMSTISVLFPALMWETLLRYAIPKRVRVSAAKTRVIISSSAATGCRSCDAFARIVSQFLMLPDSRVLVTDTEPSTTHINSGRTIVHSADGPCTCSGVERCSSWTTHHSGKIWLTCEVQVHQGIVEQQTNWIALGAVCAASPLLWFLAPAVWRSQRLGGLIDGVVSLVHQHRSEHAQVQQERSRNKKAGGIHDPLQSYDIESFVSPCCTIAPSSTGNSLPRTEGSFSKLLRKTTFFVRIPRVGSMSTSKPICIIGTAISLLQKAAVQLAALICLWLVLSQNLRNIKQESNLLPSVPSGLNQVAFGVARLDQYWSMFAPRPPDTYWWPDMPGVLGDGRQVELFQNGGMHTSQYTFTNRTAGENALPPRHNPFHVGFKSHRWFKYFELGYLGNHGFGHTDELRMAFGRWICRQFNTGRSGADLLHTYEVNMQFEQMANRDTGERRRLPAQQLWNHRCY